MSKSDEGTRIYSPISTKIYTTNPDSIPSLMGDFSFLRLEEMERKALCKSKYNKTLFGHLVLYLDV